DQALRAHRAFTAAGATCDVLGWDSLISDADLSRYRVLVLPAVYLCSRANADRITQAAGAGADVLVTAFSGIADEHDHVYLGGYPGVFTELLGVRAEEFFPLDANDSVRLETGGAGLLWTENLGVAADVEVLARYADGPLPGVAAVTRRQVGAGRAWYVSTVPDPPTWRRVAARVLEADGIARLPHVAADVEFVRRVSPTGSWLFALNHSAETVRVPAAGHDLLTGQEVDSPLVLPPGGCAVLREREP
ncbi:MAG TPA: beta-galactosidase trimerization domain-containing protein, partial [Aldersonia sp.]